MPGYLMGVMMEERLKNQIVDDIATNLKYPQQPQFPADYLGRPDPIDLYIHLGLF